MCSVLKVLNLRFVPIVQERTAKASMTEVSFNIIDKSKEAGEDEDVKIIV